VRQIKHIRHTDYFVEHPHDESQYRHTVCRSGLPETTRSRKFTHSIKTAQDPSPISGIYIPYAGSNSCDSRDKPLISTMDNLTNLPARFTINGFVTAKNRAAIIMTKTINRSTAANQPYPPPE